MPVCMLVGYFIGYLLSISVCKGIYIYARRRKEDKDKDAAADDGDDDATSTFWGVLIAKKSSRTAVARAVPVVVHDRGCKGNTGYSSVFFDVSSDDSAFEETSNILHFNSDEP